MVDRNNSPRVSGPEAAGSGILQGRASADMSVDKFVKTSSHGCAACVVVAVMRGLFMRLCLEEGSAAHTCRLMRHI